VSRLSSPHCPQLFPCGLAIISNGEDAIDKKYPTSTTSGNQFITKNLMASTLSIFPKLHEEQIPSIGSNYSLSTTHHHLPYSSNNSETNLDFPLPMVNTCNLHQSSSPPSVYIPKSIISISKSPTPEKWTSALENEINSLISQNVFDTSLIDISTIDKSLLIPSRVIFDTRLNADGTINKYKARIVSSR